MRVVIVEGEGADLGVNLGCPVVTNGAFATRLFSNYFEDLLGYIAALLYPVTLLTYLLARHCLLLQI